jgi:hypothetical protein
MGRADNTRALHVTRCSLFEETRDKTALYDQASSMWQTLWRGTTVVSAGHSPSETPRAEARALLRPNTRPTLNLLLLLRVYV